METMQPPFDINPVLDAIRKEENLSSDKALANLLKIEPSTVSRWRRGVMPDGMRNILPLVLKLRDRDSAAA